MVFRRGGTASESAKKQCALSISFVAATPYQQSGFCSVVTIDVTEGIGVCPLSPVLRGEGVRVRGLFFATVQRKHLVEFLVIHQKMNGEMIANYRG